MNEWNGDLYDIDGIKIEINIIQRQDFYVYRNRTPLLYDIFVVCTFPRSRSLGKGAPEKKKKKKKKKKRNISN